MDTVTWTDDKIDVLNDRVETLDGKVDTLTTRVDVLDGKVDVLTTRVDVLDGKVDTLTTRVDVLDGKVDVLTTRVDVLAENMYYGFARAEVEYARNAERDKRFDRLEDKVDTLNRTLLQTGGGIIGTLIAGIVTLLALGLTH
jgi:outer membrane murein-binding lipoprotein Lpp